MPDRQLDGVALAVGDPPALAAFYVDVMGMRLRRAGDELRVGYGEASADVVLRQSRSTAPYAHCPRDRYWKIGITLPNVDLAYRQLSALGVSVSEPRQFRDIGYMCHLSDPEGFQIELLQHSFADAPRIGMGDPNLPLGGGAIIGQITLRTADIETELHHFGDVLGMSLLSRQPLPDFGFDLYFLAFTGERPPKPELEAVANRPWLWQRPYTTLEFQHRLDGGVIDPPENVAGFQELVIKG